jgi:hypothetical protein
MCVQATRAVAPTRKRTRPRANLSLYLLLSLILGLLSTYMHIILQNCYACADKCYESVTVLSPFVHIAFSLDFRNQVFCSPRCPKHVHLQTPLAPWEAL